MPFPVAARSKAKVCAAAHLLRLWDRIPPGVMDVLSVVSVVCCQVKVSTMS